MKALVRYLRPSGLLLILSFALGSALIAFLFVDTWIKQAIEALGSDALGAKVEVDSAELSFRQQSLTLNQVSVTNPNQPMRNLFEVHQLHFDITLSELVFRRVHISELNATGVRLDTQRSVSGALAKNTAPSPSDTSRSGEENSLALPVLSLPDPATLIANEDLETVRLGKQLSAKYRQAQDALNAQIAQLPNREKLDDYKKRIKALKGNKFNPLALIKNADELKSLKTELDNDLASFEQLKPELDASIGELNTDLARLKQAPARDMAKLKKKYAPDTQGLSNLTQGLFGKEVRTYLAYGLKAYEVLAPWLENTGTAPVTEAFEPQRGQGHWVRFALSPPKPELVIETIELSQHDSEQSELTGEIRHLSSAPALWPEPITFSLALEQFKQSQAIAVNGRLQVPDNYQLDGTIDGLVLEALPLSSAKAFPLTLASASADISTNYRQQGSQLDMNTQLALTQVSLAKFDTEGSIQKTLYQALQAQNTLDIRARLSGDIKDPNLNIESGLDKVLSEAIAGALQSKMASFNADLSQRINARGQSQLGALSKQASGLQELKNALLNRQHSFKSLTRELSL